MKLLVSHHPARTKFFPAPCGLIIFIFAHDQHCVAKFGTACVLAHHLLRLVGCSVQFAV